MSFGAAFALQVNPFNRRGSSKGVYPWDQRALNLIECFGLNPPAVWEASSCFHSDTIANLLAVYPSLLIQIILEPALSQCRSDEIACNNRARQFAATHTVYLNLPKLLLRLGPNASRLLVTSHVTQADGLKRYQQL